MPWQLDKASLSTDFHQADYPLQAFLLLSDRADLLVNVVCGDSGQRGDQLRPWNQ